MADPGSTAAAAALWTAIGALGLKLVERLFLRADRGEDQATALRAELRAENRELKAEVDALQAANEAMRAQLQAAQAQATADREALVRMTERYREAEVRCYNLADEVAALERRRPEPTARHRALDHRGKPR